MWSTRGSRNLFYLSRRVHGVPTKVYVGTGPSADRLAAEVEARKRARQAVAEACAAQKEAVRAAEGPLDELCAGLDQVVAATLLGRGYHRHDRGPWRRKRGRPEVQADPPAGAADPA